jgi:hypothetical protein
MWQIETPYLPPYGHPNNVPMGQKKSRRKRKSRMKKIFFTNVLIPF